MSLIHTQRQEALIEDLKLSSLAERFDTPLFVYSGQFLENRCQEIIKAFSGYPTQVCYALKANSNLSILKTIFRSGIGADVVSGGEFKKALLAKCPSNQIVFSGVGKRVSEIEAALETGVLSFNAESVEEIQAIASVARKLKKKVPLSLRINPNISVKTNPYIATGLYETKFGFPESQIGEALEVLKETSELELVGLSCHLGSQIQQLTPYAEATRRLRKIASDLKHNGWTIRYLDLGGGFGVNYQGASAHSLQDYAKAIQRELTNSSYLLVVEPGRSIVAESGILLTRILYQKKNARKSFVIVDASMTELIRPALYDAYHPIEPCVKRKGSLKKVDVVGPVCETSDFLGLGRKLPPIKTGDLLWIGYCGAYASAMSSQYNVRPRAAEVLVTGKKATLIRRREKLEDLWEDEL